MFHLGCPISYIARKLFKPPNPETLGVWEMESPREISQIQELFDTEFLIKNYGKRVILKNPLKFNRIEEFIEILKQNNCERIWTTKFTVSCVKTVYVDKLKVHIDIYILTGYRKINNELVVDSFMVGR